jgi:6-phosphogluconolactonase
MSRRYAYSRRGFLGVIGSSSLLRLAGPFLPRTSAWALPAANDVRFAYVASDAQDAGGIHVFRVNGPAWKLVQSVTSESPSSLALSADQTTLFVANRRRNYQGRPTASVEAYRIDRRSGNLHLLSRRPLALSAIGPEHVAVSPNGKYLAVSVTAGGAYNLLPIDHEGKLGSVTILRKEIGASIHPEWQRSAKPQQVIFDGRGRLISSDLGCDRINVFQLDGDSLIALERNSVEPGSGPAAIELNPQGSTLFVGGALDGTITAYVYDEANGRILTSMASVKTFSRPTDSRLHALAIHPSGELVMAAWSDQRSHNVSSWRFNRKDGSFETGSTLKVQGATKVLRFFPTGDSLVAVDATNGVISLLGCDEASGNLGSIAQLASAQSPSAICFTYL